MVALWKTGWQIIKQKFCIDVQPPFPPHTHLKRSVSRPDDFTAIARCRYQFIKH